MPTPYAQPEVLVETDWVEQHRTDPDVRIVEVDAEPSEYEEGHVPGAIGWNWATQLSDQRVRDLLSKEAFEMLMSAAGIAPSTTVILYGDNNNWFAAWAFWQMKIYGHRDVRLMNGGRRKWIAEGRPLDNDLPRPEPTRYTATAADRSLRAMLKEVLVAVEQGAASLIDVRSPPEFTGEIYAPPGLPETCQRAGHIPGARNVPWGKVCNEDGTFRAREELEALYTEAGAVEGKPIIAYCRIGERSSHTWFVLKYLLGRRDVKNYDGSWTEWGNLVGAPVAVGSDRR
ncbi:MAG TPA: sulfurtransferase [Myxococcales bacterium]|nr:sulfurtransferase [Myxococcales bacterium]